MSFPERVHVCRKQVSVLDRNGWMHQVGEPLTIEPPSWYPKSMTQVHQLFNGLTTRLLRFHPFEEIARGLNEARRREDLRLGDICYSFPVRLNVTSSELSIWDGDDLMFADEYDDEEEPEAVYRTLDPGGFFDEYVFGPKYPELIDGIIGFESSADQGAVDEWRDLVR